MGKRQRWCRRSRQACRLPAHRSQENQQTSRVRKQASDECRDKAHLETRPETRCQTRCLACQPDCSLRRHWSSAITCTLRVSQPLALLFAVFLPATRDCMDGMTRARPIPLKADHTEACMHRRLSVSASVSDGCSARRAAPDARMC